MWLQKVSMLTSVAIPGCSWAAGTWTITTSALNNVLQNDVTQKNSIELLCYSLLQCIFEKQQLATLTQPQIAMEISNKATQTSVWEAPVNTFNNCTLISFLASFNFSSATLENGNNISSL
jgi:hypothetical protein